METPFYLDPDWEPPFCPNPNCPYHNHSRHQWRYKRIGSYSRKADPTCIPRWICLHCRRSFSGQTFHPTYWLKRPLILPALLMRAVGAMCNRQIARDLHVSPATIDRQLQRLGRHCLLFHFRNLLRTKLQGPLLIDGMGAWEHSQFFPFEHQVALEDQSSFLLYFTDSPLRRSGTMTKEQKRRRQELETQLGRPDPQAVSKAVRELLEVSLRGRDEAILRSDDHRAYPRAMRGLPCRIRHEITSSKQRRTMQNPLFQINLLDGLIRHSQAGHRRETWAAPKRRQGSAERLGIFVVWRNYIKWRYEKRCRKTPAMIKGLCDRALEVKDVLEKRLFRTQLELPSRWAEYYDRKVRTPVLPSNREHRLSYAY